MDIIAEKKAQEIALELREIMKKKGIIPFDIEKKGVSRQKVYSVLRMGKVARPNYSIATLIEVMQALEIEILFK